VLLKLPATEDGTFGVTTNTVTSLDAGGFIVALDLQEEMFGPNGESSLASVSLE
jgi:hypothetical protein